MAVEGKTLSQIVKEIKEAGDASIRFKVITDTDGDELYGVEDHDAIVSSDKRTLPYFTRYVTATKKSYPHVFIESDKIEKKFVTVT